MVVKLEVELEVVVGGGRDYSSSEGVVGVEYNVKSLVQCRTKRSIAQPSPPIFVRVNNGIMNRVAAKLNAISL